jgi:transcriptional regulator with XRE-family HTH domain
MSNAGSNLPPHEAVAAAFAAGTNALKALRESIGYSVEDLAIACGLARSEIDEIESGQSGDAEKLHRIARSLSLPENIFQH